MNNFLLFIGGVLVIALGAAFSIPQMVDWNDYRDVFEDEASRVLGRSIRVGGKVDLRLLPSPYVRFERLRIADSAGRFGLPFFRADSFTMHLSVAPLLRGVVEANQIELTRPRLRLGVDENGKGNWRNLGPKTASSQYIPADVALQSVKIRDGLVAMLDPTGKELYRLDAINGVFSAESIVGPYKFSGVAANRGVEREIKFSSSRSAPDGSVPFKSIVKFVASGARYVLDGKVIDISGRPKVEGNLIARLPLNLTRRSDAGKAGAAAAAPKTAADAAAFDLVSKLQVDSKGAKLSDLKLSFEQAGRPQIVTGDVTSSWAQGVETAASFKALWLDLDRIAGIGKDDGPLSAFSRFIGQLDELLGASGSSLVALTIDQANLGGDTVSNIALNLSKTGGVLRITDLRADMPGRAGLEASGTVTGTDKGRKFDGDISLHGGDLARFAAWAGKGYALPPFQGGDYFGVRCRLGIAPGEITATIVSGELARTVFSGTMQYRWRGKKLLKVDLEGPRVDARKLLPDGLRLARLGERLLAAGRGDKGSKKGGASDSLDADIKLRIGALITARTTYHDVVADAELRRGTLNIPKFKLSSGDDLSIEFSGRLAGAAGPAQKGVIRGQVKALNAKAVQALARMIELPEISIPDAARAKTLAPLRLAGKIALGQRRAGSADMTLAGTADTSRVNIIARLDGGFSGWRSAMTDISVETVNADLRRLVIQLLPGAAAFPIAAATPGTGRLKALGVPAKGLFTIASINGDGFNTSFDGRVTLPSGDGAASLAGKMSIDAVEAAPFARLAGLSSAAFGRNTPLRGTVAIKTITDGIALGDIALNLAGSDIKGQASVVTLKGGGTKVEAELSASSVSIQALLRPTLADAVGGSTSAGEAGIWPDAAFSFASFDDMRGRVTLKTPRLTLDKDLTLANVVLDAAFKKGRVTLDKLTGDLTTGSLSASLQLDSAPAGAKAKASLRVTGAMLDKLFPTPGDRPPAATGAASLQLSFEGQALSPRGLMSVLKGSGEIDLGPARLNRMAPIAVDNAADAVLKQTPSDPVQALRDELRVRLGRGDLVLGPRRIKLSVADGALKMQRFGIDTPEGAVSALNTIDLATLNLDSEWLITPKAQRSKITGQMLTQLPPVSVTYVGRLGQLTALQPRIDAEALARELTVRKMERDVEELERIRKLDEERARLEAERQAALEAERQRAAAAALDAERLQALQSQGAAPAAGAGAGVQSPLPPAPPEAPPLSLPALVPSSTAADSGTATPIPEPAPEPVPQSVPRPKRVNSSSKPSIFEQTFGAE